VREKYYLLAEKVWVIRQANRAMQREICSNDQPDQMFTPVIHVLFRAAHVTNLDFCHLVLKQVKIRLDN
jgi:hypothetical protein